MIKEFGQDIFLAAQGTNGIGDVEKKALSNLARLSRDGFEKLMIENKLDALVTPGADVAPVLAIGGSQELVSLLDMITKGCPLAFVLGPKGL